MAHGRKSNDRSGATECRVETPKWRHGLTKIGIIPWIIAMTDTEELRYAKQDGIATITLNRPDKLNAFTVAMIDAWVARLREAQSDPAVHVVVVTGAGRAFCAGGDMAQLGTEAPAALDHKRFLWEHVQQIPLTLEAMDKPVIAMVNGVAAGAGMDMALMCDLRFASDQARFAESYVKVGLVPGDGGAWFLPRLVGLDRALELMWTGDLIDAAEAFRIGVVTRVFPADELTTQTYAFAARLAAGPPLAIRMIKRAACQGLRTDLRTSLDLISSHLALVIQSNDHQEGVRAFQQKRPPQFHGN
jgi:2-(1,2-epoxy-1,2-dihydrophenyl)acetyl-CoA isomerase